ncbi:hypothetical protein HCH_05813 [Hahella chejuensis KCTC 2396]|uniref:Uncharacterized protein n=1 Tax=Hahella chejuensis (strain KCTC 2396) TaxID=349521 RepID=Q2SA60_HAHCH|nr:hypothetical protein [Hahella chejuensis]ABC32464.1 hypothetical protein HCH_05813 [Hahella chejuensis KCTC 2396]
MDTKLTACFLVPNIKLVELSRETNRLLYTLGFSKTPGIYSVTLDEDRNVIDEHGDEVFLDGEPLTEFLKKHHGYSQEFIWNERTQYCVFFERESVGYVYIDFDIVSVKKYMDSRNIKAFGDMLSYLCSALKAFGVIADFDLPFSLRDEDSLIEDFLRNPDNDSQPCSIGIFRRPLFGHQRKRLIISEGKWSIHKVEAPYVLYLSCDLEQTLRLFGGR